MAKIDFEWIAVVKLVLNEIGLNVKWFMFVLMNSRKNELKNKFENKNHFLKQKLQILTSSLDQFYLRTTKYDNVKVSWTINLRVKITLRS